MAIQLRRYVVTPGELDRFLEWFPTILSVRDKYGFKVEFAYADRENSQFIWAVSHPDFENVEPTYVSSDERTKAFEGFDNPITEVHVSMVDEVL